MEVAVGQDPERGALHDLINALPASQIDAARKYLRFLIADAEEDPIPLSVEERAAFERGKEPAARGETVSLKALKEELEGDV